MILLSALGKLIYNLEFLIVRVLGIFKYDRRMVFMILYWIMTLSLSEIFDIYIWKGENYDINDLYYFGFLCS